jgi:hypothetical protein
MEAPDVITIQAAKLPKIRAGVIANQELGLPIILVIYPSSDAIVLLQLHTGFSTGIKTGNVSY